MATRKRKKNEPPAEVFSECRGCRVRFRYRKYGFQWYTWIAVEVGGVWISIGDPKKGRVNSGSGSEIEEAVRRAEVDSL